MWMVTLGKYEVPKGEPPPRPKPPTVDVFLEGGLRPLTDDELQRYRKGEMSGTEQILWQVARLGFVGGLVSFFVGLVSHVAGIELLYRLSFVGFMVCFCPMFASLFALMVMDQMRLR
jgi:hypothetical protein